MSGLNFIDNMISDCLKRPTKYDKSDYKFIVMLSAEWKKSGNINKSEIEKLESLWEKI